jgi:Xaa-Pro aminopeptidase
MTTRARLLAGIPAENSALFHRVRFNVGDPAAWIEFPSDQAKPQQRPGTLFLVRDIEVDRARSAVKVDRVAAPAEFAPNDGLSGDRATATAQAVAECLKRNGVKHVTTDRTLPFIFAWHIQQSGIALQYDPEMGVRERRVKDAQEIEWLQRAQSVTEDAVLMACETIARSSAAVDGTLMHAGAALTSERMRRMISIYLLERGFSNHHDSIVATLPQSADCHERGSGPLKTGQAVIIDIFPQDLNTRYWGDCTRTVVHGPASDAMVKMHTAVVEAKRDAIAALLPGATADSVHAATKATLAKHGFAFARGEISDAAVLPHGTGHGVGLEVHEPILLDDNGGTLLAGEVFTVEPGLYSRHHGGVRVEDMLVVQDGAPKNLNRLPEGLTWN